ncbi:MAG: glycosyltransferase family 39 protein [Candidatus Aminicenantes bacterium]|nr:MAG: glycosyltransferase family 39 protein [Candidatus Aminicenantes bacterium]
MGKTKIQLFLLLMAILFLISLRMIQPAADPPESLSMSGGPYGDPGGYAFNARNKVLFGQWEVDKMNSPLYSSPIPALLTFLSFKIFGVGFVQMNVVPILFSCLSLVFVFLLLRKTLSGSQSLAVMGFTLLGANYLFLMYSRIANRVMPMVFFLVLALFFFQKGSKNKKWYLFAGASSFLAFMTKGVCFYIVGAFFLGLFVYLVFKLGVKKAAVPFGFCLAGFAFCLLLWGIFIYIPHGDDLKSISAINVSFLIPPKSVSRMLYYFWIRPSILFERAPILSLLSGLSLLLLLFRATHEPKKLSLLEWIMLSWFIISVLYFAVIQQRVTRHFIPQIIPMVFLSSWLIHRFLRSERITKPRRLHFTFGLVLFFWLLFPMSKIAKPILDKGPDVFSKIWIATSLLAFLSFLLVFLIIFLVRRWPKNFTLSCPPFMKKATVVVILLGVLFFNGRQYLSWALQPEYKLQHISFDLGEAFDHAAISGLWAPVICLENKHRAHESFPGFVNDEKDFLEKFQITHVFASTAFNGQEIKYYRQNFPSAMRKAQLLAKYNIWRAEMLLYDLKPSTSLISQKDEFEAEIFTQRQGMPRYDPESSGKFAVLSDKWEPGFVTIVSIQEKIPEGRYKVIFEMKLEANLSKAHPLSRIARIDIVAPETKRLLEAKDLTEDDFPDSGGYHEFPLTLDIIRPLKLNFRVYSDGLSPFWVDRIRIEKISDV